ncbi:hypothetical protein BY458DRAFT_493035 [Sporodiniella umbellata]|nr:hypothetical protein BY458DRAFT_493035 [Sporodiniella umbellata]
MSTPIREMPDRGFRNGSFANYNEMYNESSSSSSSRSLRLNQKVLLNSMNPDYIAIYENQAVPDDSSINPFLNSLGSGLVYHSSSPEATEDFPMAINPHFQTRTQSLDSNTTAASDDTTSSSQYSVNRTLLESPSEVRGPSAHHNSGALTGLRYKMKVIGMPYTRPVLTEQEKLEGRKIFLFELISRVTDATGKICIEASRRPCVHPSMARSEAEKKERFSHLAISCLWWKEKDEYYATSSDVIRIAEGLLGIALHKQQKNRMRRQMQSYSPITLSKKMSNTNNEIGAEFFARVMGYKCPSVRTIDKDIKIFRWEIIELALMKVAIQLKFNE